MKNWKMLYQYIEALFFLKVKIIFVLDLLFVILFMLWS